MRITDYEQARSLNDVQIVLTHEEAEELHLYLGALLHRPAVGAVHLSNFQNGLIERDLRVELVSPRDCAA